jgi:hypothetical protein
MHNNSKVLDEIISNERPHYDNYGLGYTHIETCSSSKLTHPKTKKISYGNTMRGSNETEEQKTLHNKDHKDTPPPKRFKFQNK